MTTRRRYEWDEAKRAANIAKHRIDFAAMEAFEWDTVVETFDDAHGEPRWIAKGYIGSRLYVAVYTERGDVIRMISLREATPKEMRDYAET